MQGRSDGAVGMEVGADGWTTPGALDWALQAGSYVALAVVVGVLATAALVWRHALGWWVLHRAARSAAVVVAILAVVQFARWSSASAGAAPWSDPAGLLDASRTDTGAALAGRAVLGAGLAGLLWVGRRDLRTGWRALAACTVALVATWALAGDAPAQPWPAVAVAVAVVHHGAAMLWCGGLAVVAVGARRGAAAADAPVLIVRFVAVARIALLVTVATGIGSTALRVHADSGWTAPLIGLVVAKAAAVIAVAALDETVRRTALRWRATPRDANPDSVASARRALRSEVVLGGAVLALTAWLG